MVPRWALAVAFAAGLAPGLILFWSARRPVAAPAPMVAPAPAPGAAPSPSSTAEAKLAGEPKKTGGVEKKTVIEREADPRLAAEHQETLAKLAESERLLAEVREKLKDAEGRTAALTEQQQAASAAEKELRQELEGWQRRMTTAESALRAREARLGEVEASLQRAQRQGAETGQRLQRVGDVAGELEEIARRRESYVNAIVARYREATDLFRAISLRLDNPRDGSSPLNNDLSRIQAAIQAADEDMRQLRALNAQSAKLQKELARR